MSYIPDKNKRKKMIEELRKIVREQEEAWESLNNCGGWTDASAGGSPPLTREAIMLSELEIYDRIDNDDDDDYDYVLF